MGVIRDTKCYTAPCKTYIDGAQDNLIRWYFVPDDRPFYLEMHCFNPRIHDAFEATGLEYEKTGMYPNPRRHNNGRDYWNSPGIAVQGDVLDFQGLATRAKYGADRGPVDGCCTEQRIVLGNLLFGAHVPERPPEQFAAAVKVAAKVVSIEPDVETIAAGLALSAKVVALRPIETGKAGVAFAGAVVNVITPIEQVKPAWEIDAAVRDQPIETVKSGVALAAAVVNRDGSIETVKAGVEFAAGVGLFPTIEHANAGLDLAAAVVDPASVRLPAKAGVEFAAAVVNVPIPIETVNAAVEFAAAVVDVPPPHGVEIKKAGIEFAAKIIDVPPPSGVEVLKAGVEFAVNVVDPPAGVTPGPTCSTAALITLGTSYGFTIGVGEDHWFKFPVAALSTYHVSMPSAGPMYPGNSVNTGTSCSGLTSQGGCNSINPCVEFTTGRSAETCYIHVQGPFVGTISYTLVADSGGC